MFNPPTLEDLQETRRANEKLVLAALESKPEWVETELAKTTGLALSHLRAALASLLDQGRVRRLPGTGTRAVYGLADPGLADVPATPLTENAKKIRDYLEGRADSALYMSDQLRLTREEVMAALSLLNAHGMITCTFVGSLVIFRLKETPGASIEPEVSAKQERTRSTAKKQAQNA
ncbi:transcriptional regulator [Deinococcus sp. VB343]|uniref:Transcriptional regulator n=1 Tax=Deinococcus sp. VB142 TaxID=3112952 RepID=A0AAU6Q2U3_9DEIO|nr:transcriptional regulator [Deinococcus sp.]MDO4245533.1 transcriptional regulator [Deinococcus sp.]